MPDTVTYINEADLIDRQAQSEKAMLDEFRGGAFTADNPLIKLNPYFVSPCAAVILFRTEKPVAVTVTVRGKEPEGNISHTFPRATEHILPVLGLYPDYENAVDIRLYQGKTSTVIIKTAPIAAKVPGLISIKTTAEHLGDQLIILSPAANGAISGFDYRGDVRWYINVSMQMDMKRLQNGHLLAGTHRLIKPPYYSTGLYEFDFAGKIYNEFLIPGGYHHDQFEMPNGDLVVLSDDLTRDTVEDVCVLIDRTTGEIKKTWDMKDILVPGEGRSGKYTPEDWFHNNAVWYDEHTNSLTLSARHIDAMINLDFDSGAINWILGDPETWPEDKQKFFFTPVGGSDFGWQYAQHACVITPDGDVMCFDNGTLRSKNSDKYVPNKDNYSRAVRYRLNLEEMTIEQVWEFGRELGSDFFSQHISNVEYYADGHYLVHAGGKQFYDGELADDILPPNDDPVARFEGLTFELKNDAVMLELRTVGNNYRAEKLPLYTDGSNLQLGEGKKLGSLLPAEQAEVPADISETTETVPEKCAMHIIEESDRFIVKARFEQGQDVLIILTGDDTRCYRVDTEDMKYAMFAGLPQLEPDPSNTSTTINKAGLSGRYELSVVIDGKRYATGAAISCGKESA